MFKKWNIAKQKNSDRLLSCRISVREGFLFLSQKFCERRKQKLHLKIMGIRPFSRGKMLSFDDMSNSDFSWDKILQNPLKTKKNETCANPLLRPYSLQKQPQLLLSLLKKKYYCRDSFAKRTSSNIYFNEND